MKCKIKITQRWGKRWYFDPQFIFEIPVERLSIAVKDMEEDENVLGYTYYIEERYFKKTAIVKIKYKKFGLAEKPYTDIINDDDF